MRGTFLLVLAAVTACAGDTTPSAIAGRPVALALGRFHSCALSVAGRLYCWGDDGAGELGVPGVKRTLTPVAVSMDPLEIRRVVVDSDLTCAELPSSGAICWGAGDPVARELAGSVGYHDFAAGTGMICGRSDAGLPVCWAGVGSVSTGVSGGGPMHGLVAGAHHACGIAADSTAWCWGPGFVATQVADSLRFVLLTDGGDHACGATADSVAYCWGANGVGQLGIGNESSVFGAVPVQGLPSGLAIRALAAAPGYTCVVMSDQSAGCWGGSFWDQLGIGSVLGPVVDLPTSLDFQPSWAQIYVGGGSTTCAVTTAGDTYCWGRNDLGQVGSGDTTSSVLEAEAVTFR